MEAICRLYPWALSSYHDGMRKFAIGLPARARASLVGAAALAAALMGACGESSLGGSEDGLGDDSTVDGIATDGSVLPGDDLTGSGGNGMGGASASGSQCEGDVDCLNGQSCHPVQHVCVRAGASCTTQDECKNATFCDALSQSCLPGLSGSACGSDANCVSGSHCSGGVCQCMGFQREQETISGPLDIYFMFDRTGSMGDDCAYVVGDEPPVGSKACYATYAMNDYLTTVSPQVETRLAFQFMSYEDGCDGTPYATPLEDFAALPILPDSSLVQAISDEEFRGGSGTQIEGALIGISSFTKASQTPGREIIGVLMTDGDPQGCDEDIDHLAQIIQSHHDSTGIRTFIIGMEGATESNLEAMALAGGAEAHSDFCGSLTPPCHYWNVGDGSGEAIQSALTAIAVQAAPFPCKYDLDEVGSTIDGGLDLKTLNVQLSEGGQTTLIGKVEGRSICPDSKPAWYFNSNSAPTEVVLCPAACDLVTGAQSGAKLSIVGGCSETVIFE
jgi:hypothetical protein